MKNRKLYKRIKEGVIVGAGSGLVAGMIFMGSANAVIAEGVESQGTAYTENTGMHVMHRWNSQGKISALASNLGLDQSYIKQELKSGKTLKAILQENNLTPVELDKAFNGKSRHKSWRKHSIQS